MASKTKTILLVQGPESCEELLKLHRRGELGAVDRWVSYDARCTQKLDQAGIASVPDDFYEEADPARLEFLENEAHRLACEWFRSLPKDAALGVHVEKFFIRTFNYCFLALFRAFYLLERIREVEGVCALWTTAPRNTPGAVRGIRWATEESPVPGLLKSLNHCWKFDVRFFECDAAPPAKAAPAQALPLAALWQKALGRGKPNAAWFSGNPKLLDSVRAELETLGKPSLRLRTVFSLRDALAAFKKDTLGLAVPAPEKGRFDASETRKKLEEARAFTVDGENFLPVVWERICFFYEREAPKLRSFYRAALSLLGAARPSSLVLDEDVTEYQRALASAAAEKGIPTLVVMHGLLGAPIGFMPLEAGRIAVWGDYHKEILQNWGLDPERIVVTGCPKYDSLSRQAPDKKDAKRQLCREFGWDAEKPVVLVTPPVLRPNALERFLEGVSPNALVRLAGDWIRAAKETPGVHFIYKLHSGGWDARVYEAVAREAGGLPSNFKWATRGIAADYIAGCDLLFNSISSAVIEAVILGTPVVHMDFTRKPDVYSFRRHGISAAVSSPEEMLSLCAKLEKGLLPLEEWRRAQEAMVAPFIYSRDAKSSARVAAVLRADIDKKLSPYVKVG